METSRRKFLVSLLPGLALLGGIAPAPVPASDAGEVLVLARRRQPAHEELVNALRDRLAEIGAPEVQAMRAAKFTRAALGGDHGRPPALIVAIGTDVTLDVLALKLPVPVLSVAIPRLSFDELSQQRDGSGPARDPGQWSAIYLDQPLDRRLNLIRQIIPKARRVGVVLGPSTVPYEAELREAAARRKLTLQLGRATEEGHLIRTLDRVLKESDVMLGVVDPLVFSRASARSVLLTAYRRRVPLIGISPGYVSAGALAAVYSSPAEIGRQVAEAIEEFRNDPAGRLPPPRYPKYFSVAVNYQVAESMGLQVDDEERLRHRLAGQGDSP